MIWICSELSGSGLQRYRVRCFEGEVGNVECCCCINCGNGRDIYRMFMRKRWIIVKVLRFPQKSMVQGNEGLDIRKLKKQSARSKQLGKDEILPGGEHAEPL